MKPKVFLTILALGIIVSVFGQRQTLDLTFTAIDNGAYVQLDSIKVMNRSQGGDTVLYWPDTVLVLEYYPVGIFEVNSNQERLQVFQNYPNPVMDQTIISIYVPEKDKVNLIASDVLGREVIHTEMVLERGHHSFRFSPGDGSLFFFTAQWRDKSSSITILQTASNSYGKSSLEYVSSEASSPQLKGTADIQSFLFNLGDELLYIGYANGLQSGMLDAPEANETHTFQFATNIPCPGTPTVNYGGQVYNTIQIFSQCWLKENLNVGVMIPGTQQMNDNNTIEKYCYDNEPDSCSKYGGLYQWWEMMKYTTQQGVQGICPPGWHISTDDEWKVLEGAVDSQYGIGDNIWDDLYDRGFDAGTALKTTSGWYYGDNGTDLFGFSGLPGGARGASGLFFYVGLYGEWWMSTESNSNPTLMRWLSSGPEVGRQFSYKEIGYSVRCIRDY